MIILTASTIAEGNLQPKLNALLLVEDNRIFRYIGMSIFPMEISNIRHNITEEEIIDLIKSKIKDLQGEELTPEQALEGHPDIKNQIIHLLRDKKLDELL